MVPYNPVPRANCQNLICICTCLVQVMSPRRQKSASDQSVSTPIVLSLSLCSYSQEVREEWP